MAANEKEQPPSFDQHVAAALPEYSAQHQPRALTEHSYSLRDSSDRAWVTLKVFSRAPSAATPPSFLDGDLITGRVEINLAKPESVKAVTISVYAENTPVGQDGLPFLDLTTTLWTGAKLAGTQSWPFSLTLPKEASVAEVPKGPVKSYPLPPSFSERGSPSYVDYKLIATVKRGALRVNQTLSASFAFVPRTRAPPPSALRQMAYAEGSAIVGPEGDPEGWKVLPPVKVTGTLFDTKAVELDCTLALATPLSYATGSPVALDLTVHCSDQQALDLLCAPSSISLYLTRSIAIGSEATNDTAPRRSNNTFTEHVGKAFFWPSEEGAPEPGTRRLQGEIEVKKGLKPSFVFARFTVRYTLTMLPFKAAGFSPATPADQPLVSERVSIVTENAAGVAPRSRAPPGYVRADEADYNNAVGYLENGNQRFYHLHGGF